ncbi:ROK family protein, partial [bacterium]|nr:ROK family protein [bacterium]
MKKALAVDIGGTKIYYAVIDESGKIDSEVMKEATPKTLEGFKELFTRIFNLFEVDFIAISTAGAVNNENTRVISSTGNLVEGYRDLDFQSFTKTPVFVENDANCAAWAEHVLGSSKGMANSIMLTLGTGVGGGIIINDRLLKGKSGSAGEMHFKMYSDNRLKCTCGAWDCFEAYASGTGLQKTAAEMSANPNITTYDVIDGVNAKDEKMVEIFNQWQEHIIIGCIGLANLFDPDCIVFSGSMAEFIN